MRKRKYVKAFMKTVYVDKRLINVLFPLIFMKFFVQMYTTSTKYIKIRRLYGLNYNICFYFCPCYNYVDKNIGG